MYYKEHSFDHSLILQFGHYSDFFLKNYEQVGYSPDICHFRIDLKRHHETFVLKNGLGGLLGLRATVPSLVLALDLKTLPLSLNNLFLEIQNQSRQPADKKKKEKTQKTKKTPRS